MRENNDFVFYLAMRRRQPSPAWGRLKNEVSYKYSKKLVGCAQHLRKSMTDEEKHLWNDFLKQLPLTVNRQKNIGCYIVDFYIAAKKIVIELDGFQRGTPEQAEKDATRNAYLQKMGITVLRYQNTDINQKFDDVCRNILTHLNL